MENVILNSSQTQIKIVDFGLSNVWSSDNPLRTHCGSPEYAAPELFIAGREYGPEVDLWSLGIIFYGMVVGQLPFVGGRKNQLSSQERRKKLVAQIHKGLGTSQRQAIAPLSPEFRIMLSKLLTADPVKRMSSKELLIHPWVTEKGRKFVQTHPIEELSFESKTKLMSQISNLFQMNLNTVTTEITKNPYGRLGGMYNILTYKHYKETFNPDNIAPNTSVNKKEPTSNRNSTRSRSQHTLYNQCIVLLNKVSKQQVETRAKTAHPSSLHSKNISRLARCNADYAQGRCQSAKPNFSKTNSVVINRKNKESSVKPVSCKKSVSSSIQIKENKQSSTNTTKRPHTTGTTQNTTSLFKRGSITANQNQENCRRQIHINLKAMGDMGISAEKTSSNIGLQKQRTKSHLDSEPIARSIAGYLTKNVPKCMLNLQLTRK